MTKPPMPDVLRPIAEAALARCWKRPPGVDVVTSPVQHSHLELLTCPYRDEDLDLWMGLVLDAFGTRIASVGQTFLRQLAALCPDVLYEDEERTRTCEESLRQAVCIVHGLKPRNEAEAAHAAQLVALHFAAMKVGKSAARYDWLPLPHANCLAALVKAYGDGLERFSRMRGGKRRSIKQTIRVERHTHQHVHFAEGGGENPRRQFHGRDSARARARGTVQCPQEIGGAVPLLSGEGPDALPVPRGPCGRA
jgi:hypothetical protein